MEKQHLDATLASCLCALAEALLHKAQAAGEGGESLGWQAAGLGGLH